MISSQYYSIKTWSSQWPVSIVWPWPRSYDLKLSHVSYVYHKKYIFSHTELFTTFHSAIKSV